LPCEIAADDDCRGVCDQGAVGHEGPHTCWECENPWAGIDDHEDHFDVEKKQSSSSTDLFAGFQVLLELHLIVIAYIGDLTFLAAKRALGEAGMVITILASSELGNRQVQAARTNTDSMPHYYDCNCCSIPASWYKRCIFCRHWTGKHWNWQCFRMAEDQRGRLLPVCYCCIPVRPREWLDGGLRLILNSDSDHGGGPSVVVPRCARLCRHGTPCGLMRGHGGHHMIRCEACITETPPPSRATERQEVQINNAKTNNKIIATADLSDFVDTDSEDGWCTD
jgi:hypothetical protein